ncbi:MAG: hypothetical protein ACRCYD_00735 [Plesiomonas sp.]
MTRKDLNFYCSGVEISTVNSQDCNVEVSDADVNDVLSNFTADDIVGNFNIGELLDVIGEQEVKDHFGLVSE